MERDAGSTTSHAADIVAVFPAGRGITWWRDRNQRSPVPGEWPYGLDQLATSAHHVRALELADPGRLARFAIRAGRHPRPGGEVASRALGWEESSAVLMACTQVGVQQYCGVIWATDRAYEPGAPDQRVLKRALRRMDGLWVLVETQVERVEAWLGTKHPPVSYLRFGVDADFYSPTSERPERLIVSIGGDRDRDPDTLFASLAAVHAAEGDVRAIVQSTSPQAPPPGTEVHRFIPHATMRKLYRRAAVVAIPTRWNQHGSGITVALEAAASGRPVVATDTPGMSDYIVAGVTGELVPPGDVDAFAAALSALLADPERADDFGRAGRRRVEQEFNTRRMCERLLGICGLPESPDVATTSALDPPAR